MVPLPAQDSLVELAVKVKPIMEIGKTRIHKKMKFNFIFISLIIVYYWVEFGELSSNLVKN